MSIWKTLLASAAMAAALLAAPAQAQDQKRIALVPKALGIGFFEAAAKGAEEAAAELGDVEIIYTGPTDTTAEGQIEVINALIAQERRRDRGLRQRPRRAGAGAEEGDGPRHHRHLLGFRRRARGPADEPQPVVDRADRQHDHQARRRPPARGRRRRGALGLGHRHEPEHLDRGDEQGHGQLPGHQRGDDRLRRRPRRQVLPRDPGPDADLPGPEGDHRPDLGRHRRRGAGRHRRRQGRRRSTSPASGCRRRWRATSTAARPSPSRSGTRSTSATRRR